MNRTLASLVVAAMLLSALILPVSAQENAEPVQLPDGTFVIPGSEEDPTTSDTETNTEQTEDNPSEDTQARDFISGVAVGVAVGFVAGGVIAWFLKPEDL